MGPLAGKRALVTGSSAGLGAGIARRLAQDGATVCLHGRDAVRLEAACADIGGRDGVHMVTGSLSDDAGAATVFGAAVRAMDGIDILVNNAGGESAGRGQAAWLDTTPDEWLATYNSNVVSMVRLIRLAVPGMKARGWGRLIQLSSVSVDTPMAFIPGYQAAKTAIRSLTRSLALTLAKTGITANSVSPGLTHSTNTDDWMRRMLAEQGWTGAEEDFPAASDRMMANNFVGRVGTPADIAHAVAFIADPRADHVNAIDVLIDGGH